jgi:hypothetical protein
MLMHCHNATVGLSPLMEVSCPMTCLLLLVGIYHLVRACQVIIVVYGLMCNDMEPSRKPAALRLKCDDPRIRGGSTAVRACSKTYVCISWL